VQPVHFQGTIEATWNPILEQLDHRGEILPQPIAAPISQTAFHA
jgi:hypothetical protein